MSFSVNIFADFQTILSFQFMQHAYEAGTLVAIIAGLTGYFVVLRKSAFTAHAFSEMGFAGAAGAVLVGIPPIAGLLIGSTTGGLAIATLAKKATNRDTQIGIVLAFALGLGLLFISEYKAYATATYSILFGEILGVSYNDVLLTSVAAVGIIACLALIYRPLLFASLDEDVAEAKGVPMLFLGTLFLVIVAVAVSFAVQVTGVLLIFSLMVTPGATAQYLTRKPSTAIIYSVAIALVATWSGLFIAFYEQPPVSFFITGEVFAFYLIIRLVRQGIRPSKIADTERQIPMASPRRQINELI